MSVRWRFWTLLAIPAVLLVLVLSMGGAWTLTKIDHPEAQFRFLLTLAGGGFLLLAVLVCVFAYLDRQLIHPLRVTTRGARIIADANTGHMLELPDSHLLGDLPDAVHALAEDLGRSRREVAEAIGAGGTRAEELAERLELVIKELDEGVIVCDSDARVLLYNPAALRALGGELSLGLGRSLYEFVSRAPIEHSLDSLRSRDSEASADEKAEFVCASINSGVLLRCRLRMLSPAPDSAPGFVVAFEDVSRLVDALRQRDNLLRKVLENVRAPLANLRAAAENLSTYPDMDREMLRRFELVISEESVVLSEQLEAVARDSQALIGSHWLISDIYSADLVDSVIRRMKRGGEMSITMTGIPLWLHGDGYALTLLIERLLNRLRTQVGADEYDIETLLGDRRIYLDIVWQGQPLQESILRTWLDEPLPNAVGVLRLRDVVELHGGDAWSQVHRRSGYAVLRLPLPASERQWKPPREPAPSRPEFHYFGLADRSVPDALAARSLADLDYVVFDTETTGLKPTQGDEIVSIAGLRIVRGPILSGETFERLVNPGRLIPRTSARIHGITDAQVKDKPPIQVVLPQFKEFIADAVLVAHNSAFDMKFLRLKEAEAGIKIDNPVLDTLLLSVFLHDHLSDHTLDGIAKRLGVEVIDRHTALGDSIVTAEVFLILLDLLSGRGITTFGEAIEISEKVVEVRRMQEQLTEER